MAGIEKICEYSGEYPGSDMYGYKQDHIQILPQYRKLFRHQPHVLFWLQPKLRWVYKWGGVMDYNPQELTWFDPPFRSVPEYERYLNVHRQLEYWFVLYVPGVPGQVNGEYANYTRSRTSTRRRLKRMLKCRKLNEISLDTTIEDFDITEYVNHHDQD